MRCGNPNLLVPVVALVACVAMVSAQGPTYRLGKTPTQEEIKAWDISVGPEGKELPPGKGTAKEGAGLYAQKCASCHGPTGEEITVYHRPLVGGKGSLTTIQPVKTIGNYYAYATTLWDHINRSMPLNQPGLPPDEVYALTAFLLYRNDIIKEGDLLDAKSLPKIQMPARNIFIPAEPEWKPGYYQPYWEPQPMPRTKKP